jgi:hypothetical protein
MTYRETQIDEAFPVAGVDNESQGFRDNFSAIKDTLVQAKSDIEDLQESRLDISSPDTNMSGNTITDVNLKGASFEFNAGGNLTASQNVSYAAGSYHVYTIAKVGPSSGSPIELTLSDLPPAGKLAIIRIHLYGNGTQQFFSFNSEVVGDFYYAGGWPNTLSVTSSTNFKVFEFWTYDGGANVFGKYLGEFNNSGLDFKVENLIVSGNLTVNGLTSIPGLTINDINDIVNVNITSPQAGQVLKFNGSAWINGTDNTGGGGSGASTINDLTDAVLSSPITNQVLLYNGSKWVNDDLPLNISAETTSGGANLRLTSFTTDDVKFESGYGINVTRKDANTIRVDSENFKEYNITIDDDGSGTQEIFFIDGVKITEAGLKFTPGFTYKFNLSDSSNSGAPLKFSTTPDTAVPASITPYTTNVTSVGTPGTANSYTEIKISSSTPNLYLYGDETGSMIDTSKIGGEIQIAMGGTETRVLVRKDYTAIPNQQIIADSESGPFTISLPLASRAGDFVSIVDNGNATDNAITIDKNGSLIDGTATNLIINSNYTAITLVSDGTNWIVQSAFGILDSQDLTNGGVVDSRAGTVYFSTSGSETATLPATSGSGRVITFAMVTDGGDMVITVSNHAWSGAGTMTFNAIGQSCTMQYIANKWFCIGNNGVTFG